MNYTFIDFETTGLNPKENHPTEVAIMQIGVDKMGNAFEKRYESLIQLPEGVEISEFIQGLTGLTTEKCNTEGKPLAQVIVETQEFLNNNNNIIVAQSANFDIGYLSVHFGIDPDYFICTKTIEFMTAPHLPNGLNEMYKRYAPDIAFEQTHRAMDDVIMLAQVFDGQIMIHGIEGIDFFLNKIAITPERPLVFTPQNAKVLNFDARFVTRKTYEKTYAKAEGLE